MTVNGNTYYAKDCPSTCRELPYPTASACVNRSSRHRLRMLGRAGRLQGRAHIDHDTDRHVLPRRVQNHPAPQKATATPATAWIRPTTAGWRKTTRPELEADKALPGHRRDQAAVQRGQRLPREPDRKPIMRLRRPAAGQLRRPLLRMPGGMPDRRASSTRRVIQTCRTHARTAAGNYLAACKSCYAGCMVQKSSIDALDSAAAATDNCTKCGWQYRLFPEGDELPDLLAERLRRKPPVRLHLLRQGLPRGDPAQRRARRACSARRRTCMTRR